MSALRQPLRLTAVVLLVALLTGLAGTFWISRQPVSDRRKTERVERLGTGVGVICLLVLAPAWISAAARVGRERRERRVTPRPE